MSMMPLIVPDPDARLWRLANQMIAAPGFTESLAINTWSNLSEAEQRARMDMKEFARYEETQFRQEQYYFEVGEVPYFTALHAKGDQTMDWVFSSAQWTEEERQEHYRQGMIPYVINNLKRYGMTAMGERMGQDTEVEVKSVRPEHNSFASAANTLFRYFDKRNDWKMQKNYVYRDGMAANFGVSGTYADPFDPFGAIVTKRFRRREFLWHTRTATDPRLRECKYFERIYYVDRARAIAEFPEFAAEILAFNPGAYGQYATHIQSLDVLLKPTIQPLSGQFASPYVHNPAQFNYWRDAILRRDFFRRHPVQKYRVFDPYRKKLVDFPSQDMAETWRAQTVAYWQNIFAANGINAEPQISRVIAYTAEVIERCISIGSILVRVEQFGEDFGYHLFCPEFNDGSISAHFAAGIDAQRIGNRMFSRIDRAAGGAKGKAIFNDWGLPQGMTDDEINEMLASDTAVIRVSVPPGQTLDNVYRVTGTPNIGELPSMMLDIALKGTEQMFGGVNTIGQQESSAESGRAVLARQTAASLAMVPYEEEFWAWDEQRAKHELQLIQRVDPVILQTIISSVDPGQADEIYAAFIEQGVQSLEEIDLDCDLVEVQASPSTKDRNAANISFIMGQDAQNARYWAPALIENLDIDEKIKQKVLGDMQADAQAQQQAEAEAQAHQQYIERTTLDLQHLDRQIRLAEVQIKAAPPVQRSLMGKIDMTNPAMAASYLNASRIPADPAGVASDLAAGGMIRQGFRDLQQIHRNELLLPEEKKALEHKAKQPYKNVPTAQDSEARADKGSS